MNIAGQPAEVRMTLQITRKETGKTETVELVGHVIPEQPQEKEPEHGDDTQHSGA